MIFNVEFSFDTKTLFKSILQRLNELNVIFIDEEVKSIDFGVKRLENPEVKEGLASLKNEVTDDSPLNKLIYASFYEENGLLLDALTKYEEAIQLAPDIQDFQDLYDNFKLKNGLVTDAE